MWNKHMAGSRRPLIFRYCCTWTILYVVYTVLSRNSWSCHPETERDDFSSISYLMVVWSPRKKVMRGGREKQYQKMGLMRFSCVSQSTIESRSGTAPNLLGMITYMWSSTPYQASCTPDFWYLLISSILFSCSSPISHSHPELYYNSRSQYLVIDLYSCTQWSLLNTMYIILRVEYTTCTPSTQNCLGFLHSCNYELISKSCFSFWHAFVQIISHQPLLHESPKVMSPCKIALVAW